MLDPEHCWQAVCARDAEYDGRFVFAVRSTGIYCRPSCPARRPRRDNVSFHADAASAEAAGFRPCRRCSPHTRSPAQQLDELIAAACERLRQQPQQTLAQLAKCIGLSPSHLARAFKARTGLTPRAWAAAERRRRLEQHLPQAPSVLDAALSAGYSGTRAIYEDSPGMAPARRRLRGAGEHLRYAISPCTLGWLSATRESAPCYWVMSLKLYARNCSSASPLPNWLRILRGCSPGWSKCWPTCRNRSAPSTCHWIFVAQPFRNVSGKRYKAFPMAPPEAMGNWPNSCIAIHAPSPEPAPAMPLPYYCHATGWSPATVALAVTAGACSASSDCWSRRAPSSSLVKPSATPEESLVIFPRHTRGLATLTAVFIRTNKPDASHGSLHP